MGAQSPAASAEDDEGHGPCGSEMRRLHPGDPAAQENGLPRCVCGCFVHRAWRREADGQSGGSQAEDAARQRSKTAELLAAALGRVSRTLWLVARLL